MISFPDRLLRWHGLALLLLGGTALALGGLLARTGYGGLFGQDSYAYYYQGVAFWQALGGHAAPPGQLFSTDGLYHWPIGYHLHLVLGFLLAGVGPQTAQAVNGLFALGTPLVVYALAGALWPGAGAAARAGAGLVAGGALVLTGTYTRVGLTLMADVPGLFWGVAAVYCAVRAWPPTPTGNRGRSRRAWALAAGGALGGAVLVRYAALLLLLPLAVYMLARWWTTRRAGAGGANPSPLWALPGFACALLPQAAYLLTHPAGAAYSEWLADWNLANFVQTTVSNADGTRLFAQSNLVFYFVRPLSDAATGFLSEWYAPLILLGVVVLLRARAWPALALLASWWLLPALFYSGTPYQAHRFALTYLPALTILLGIGAAQGAAWVVAALRARRGRAWADGLADSLVALMVGGLLVAGAVQGARSATSWLVTQAGWQAEEQAVAVQAQGVAASSARSEPPRALCFGITAALYHYTGWPVVDLYSVDEAGIAQFLAAPGPRLVVVPVASLETQWTTTPTGARWRWVQAHYDLHVVSNSGLYTIYTVGAPR